MRKALTIKFGEPPRDLGERVGFARAFQKITDSSWVWKSGCGNIYLFTQEDTPEKLFSMDIYGTNAVGITQKRIHNFVRIMQGHYVECEVEYNKNYF